MGPTNVALVKLFRADQALREAQSRLDAASKNVRVQERRVHDLAERLKLAQSKLREQQSRGGQFELDIKSRDARIDKLRTQQSNANNNKEYQTFLIEINTEKVDRGKTEDELMKVMEAVEKGQAEVKELTAQHEAEKAKLAEMKSQIGETVARLQAEVDAQRPARQAAADALPPKARDAFDRLAERYDGEAMSALAKPDRRREEYLCTACMMDLVTNIYNRLHSRDELVACTSCGRILYIPEELPPEVAINSNKGSREPREPSELGAKAPARRSKNVERLDPSERRAKGRIGQLLAAAQGESVKIALDADQKPVECDVAVDGKPMGVYKGKSGEHLARIISLRMEEAGMKGTVEVREKAEEAAPPADASQADSTPTESPAPESAQAADDASAGESTPEEHSTTEDAPREHSQSTS
jgi:predicted  nucleic acid-binding Zn-ribbon protein